MSRDLSSFSRRSCFFTSIWQRTWVVLFISLCFIQGCDSGGTKKQVTVFAASSLTDVLQILKDEFEKHSPHSEVRLVFGGSQILRFQIEQGAAADLFISAHPDHVQSVIDQGLMTNPELIAENPLVVMVAPELSGEITQFDQLIAVQSLVIGDENVPLGTYTEEVLDKADQIIGQKFAERLKAAVVSRESNSRLVRSKILLGEADAAIVYESDARLTEAGVIRLPKLLEAKARYTIASNDSGHLEVAQEFRDFLVSERAREVFTEFEMPTLFNNNDTPNNLDASNNEEVRDE